jgi:hypothetical protein
MKHDNILQMRGHEIHPRAWSHGPLVPFEGERRIVRSARRRLYLARGVCIACVLALAVIGAGCVAVHLGNIISRWPL